ncbi:MAG: hypothetical protein EOP11_21835, partial [Proteobacteria bacterium]
MKIRAFKSAPLLLALMAILSACGNSKYSNQGYTADASAGNQAVYTKPKVDIVFFQDDSDSTMYGPINALKSQMNSFTNNLSDRVDYRFVVMPLLTSKDAAFVSSKFIMAADCASAPNVNRCIPTGNAARFNSLTADQGWITTANSSVANRDYGFVGIRNNLNALRSSGILRSDAPLITVVLTNGNDVDGAQLTTRGDGVTVISGYDESALNSHASAIAAFKGTQKQNFYPVIADGGTCYGAPSVAGTRYARMASVLSTYTSTKNSQVFNLCGGQLLAVLDQIYADAQTLVQQVVFDKVVLDSTYPPNEATIEVYLNGAKIPKDAWVYQGSAGRQTVNTSY